MKKHNSLNIRIMYEKRSVVRGTTQCRIEDVIITYSMYFDFLRVSN